MTDDRSRSDRARSQAVREGVSTSRLEVRVLPREYFDILDARMCILERTQRRIGIVDEKKLLRLNTYGDRNHFALHAPTLKVGEATAPALRLRHPPSADYAW